MSERMERFLKSIYIDNVEDYDMDFDMLSKNRFIPDQYDMIICKRTPWEYPKLEEFLSHLSYIKYKYTLRFSYIKGPSTQDVIELFFDWYSAHYRFELDLDISAEEGVDQINFTYETKKQEETYHPIIKEFSDLLDYLNYQFVLHENTLDTTDNEYTKEEKDRTLSEASEQALETIKESQNEGNDYSYIDTLEEEEDELQDSYQQALVADIEKTMASIKKDRERESLNRTGNFTHIDSIDKISDSSGTIDFDAYVFSVNVRTFARGGLIVQLGVHDDISAINVNADPSSLESFTEDYENLNGLKVRIRGSVYTERNNQNLAVRAKYVDVIAPDIVEHEKSETPRVELHLHTGMSSLDGVSSISEYCNYAKQLGHKAIAITDHAVVQGFPEAYKAAKQTGLKMIYGCEVYLTDQEQDIVYNPTDKKLNDVTYVVLDLETTGLSSTRNDIIEFAGVKLKSGEKAMHYDVLINPGYSLTSFVSSLTHLTDQDLKNKPRFEEVIDSILDFLGDSVLVTHNASFDFGILNSELERHGRKPLTNSVIDTLAISHYTDPNAKSHRLENLCKRNDVYYDTKSAHRADYDADVLYEVWRKLLNEYLDKNPSMTLNDLARIEPPSDITKALHSYDAVVIAKNQKGLKDLYKLVSEAHTTYLGNIPKTPRKLLSENRENLLIGSACFNGEVFEYARNKTRDELKQKMLFYDYIEVQPLENYSFLVNMGELTSEEVIDIVKTIIDCADQLHIPVVATGDCHYCRKSDKEFRDVFIGTKEKGKTPRHPLNPSERDDLDYFPNPDQYYRSTDEMLECFSFLGEEKAYEIVVTNSNLIASQTEELTPVPNDKLYTPQIENVDSILKDLCFTNAHNLYGDPLPEEIQRRLTTELNGIISNGYAVIYYLAYLVCKKTHDDGYVIGSRGSVGSSFAATMAGITEVNPLPPHYVCPKCHYFEWGSEHYPDIRSGYDLPDKMCPNCGEKLVGDGQNIPFETFLGFEAEKTPDIDLNLPTEYQETAHNFLREYLGEDHVFRAGTVTTCQEKTAYAKVLDYYSWRKIDVKTVPKAKIDYLVSGCLKVKNTTGQHPAGLIVVPSGYDIYDFTPIQYPSNDATKGSKTTHFEYRYLHDSVLKIDLLGHVDPTAINMMSNLSGFSYDKIPFNDKKVISLFSSPEELHLKDNYLKLKTGCLGLPEYGTEFVRGIIEATHPTSFADLVIIEGISHGTEVWQGNAESLIKDEGVKLKDVIGCRDDIMTYLMTKGVPHEVAFSIMEDVRRGKGVKKEYEKTMKACNVPTYYINSCNKIAYLFPKGHATAYAIMGYRVAYYKLYYPIVYYATFFSVRTKQFEIGTMIAGEKSIISRFEQLKEKQKVEKLSPKESEILDTLRICIEMYERGIKFSNIDINKSEAVNFVIDKETNSLIPPFISIDGIGENVAQSVVEARKEKPFSSIQDLKERTLLSSTNINELTALGVLNDFPEEDTLFEQLSLF